MFDKEAFEATRQGKWVREHTTREIYKPGESADDAGQLAFPVQEGRWKQLPGNEGLRRFFKPKRKPAEKPEVPPPVEGDDADDESPPADEREPMWGDEELARIDGDEADPIKDDEDQEPPGGSDDPAMDESGGMDNTPLKTIGRDAENTSFEYIRFPAPRASHPHYVTRNHRFRLKTSRYIVPQCLICSTR